MYTDRLWDEWTQHEGKNYTIKNGEPVYEKKSYTHFDRRFWFPERKDELQLILKNGLAVYNKLTGKYDAWAFHPFLKILVKTPRFRYQEGEADYGLDMKIRPICFASHFDSLIFGFYSFCISRIYESYIRSRKFDECVLAYRSDLGLSNIQFAKEVFEKVRSRGNCTAIALDIKGYFDHIDHRTLKEKWRKVIDAEMLPPDQYNIFKTLTRYSYATKEKLYKIFRPELVRNRKEPRAILDLIPGAKNSDKFNILREKRLIVNNKSKNKSTGSRIGVPQGSAMSALLSNIYLIDYDEEIYRKSIEEGFIYRRYCDDILIICNTEDSTRLQNYAIEKISNDYHLEIQPKKVETIDFRPNSRNIIRAFKRMKGSSEPAKTGKTNEQRFYKSLQYLGFEFNGQDIFVRSSSLSRYFRKMKARVEKTVGMAYSPHSKSDKIFKKQLLEKYTYKGKRNFISYVFNAASVTYSNSKGEIRIGMDSPAIRKQIARHSSLVAFVLKTKNEQRLQFKKQRNKPVSRKAT